MSLKEIDFLIAGVGGQGTVVASDIVSDVGVRAATTSRNRTSWGLRYEGEASSATFGGPSGFTPP
jgi:Pyruvate/2-oxoacid:ferredoxin oxidoreductase gamma subunit